jgi:hypothetical protein
MRCLLSTCLVLAVSFALGTAAAQAQVPTVGPLALHLDTCAYPLQGGCGYYSRRGGSQRIEVRCQPDGSGEMSWTANGVDSMPPYGGPFTITGSAQLAPGPPDRDVPVRNFDVRYTHDSDRGHIEGRLLPDPASPVLGHCGREEPRVPDWSSIDSPFSTTAHTQCAAPQGQCWVRWEATLRHTSGRLYEDEGRASFHVEARTVVRPPAGGMVTTIGWVTVSVDSDRAAARPLPMTRAECKGGGFRVFEFRNRGACVAYVAEH